MPTLRRHDGSQFIIQSYRELLPADRASALKRRIRLLAQRYGSNVKLFKNTPTDNIEAVFSRETGFLLGETLWTYLNKPSNLIYCEMLPERRQGLLVVVKNNVVFIDTKMSFTNLVDEFMSLSATDEQFDIYTWGDVPLARTAEGGKFAFNAKNVKTFTELEEPLLEKLPITAEAQLQPLELALTSPLLGKSILVPSLVIAVVLIFSIVAWHLLHKAATIDAPRFMAPKPVVSPYIGYYKALETPSPKSQLIEFAKITSLVQTIPGWSIISIKYSNKQFYCTLRINDDGTLAQIQKWANANSFNFTLKDKEVTLTTQSNLVNRTKQKTIYPIQELLISLTDNLALSLSRKNVSFTSPISLGQYKSAKLTLNTTAASMGKLLLIGAQLHDTPTTITQINMSISKDDTFSGNIELKVLGD